MLLGTYGLQQLLSAKNTAMDRKKKYVPPEDPEVTLKVFGQQLKIKSHLACVDSIVSTIFTFRIILCDFLDRKCKRRCWPKILVLGKPIDFNLFQHPDNIVR
jgi:hypothetical protein